MQQTKGSSADTVWIPEKKRCQAGGRLAARQAKQLLCCSNNRPHLQRARVGPSTTHSLQCCSCQQAWPSSGNAKLEHTPGMCVLMTG